MDNVVEKYREFIRSACKVAGNAAGAEAIIKAIEVERAGPNLRIPSIVCCIGKRGTGVTTLCKTYLNAFKKNFSRVIIIDPSHTYSDYVGECEVQDTLPDDLTNAKEKTLLVLDDFIKDARADIKSLRELFLNHQSYCLTILLTMKFPVGLPPDMRCKIDYIFLFKEEFPSNLKRLYDHYGNKFNSYDDFVDKLIEMTAQPYHGMLIDRTRDVVLPFHSRQWQAQNNRFKC